MTIRVTKPPEGAESILYLPAIEALIEGIATANVEMMKAHGEVSPKLIVLDSMGMVLGIGALPTPKDRDERRAVAEAVRRGIREQTRDAAMVVHIAEAWTTIIDAKGDPLDAAARAAIPPSESPERREVLVVAIETRTDSRTLMYDTMRDEAGNFVTFELESDLYSSELSTGNYCRWLTEHADPEPLTDRVSRSVRN